MIVLAALGGAQANHVQSVENGRCKLWQLSVPDSEFVASETQPIAWRGTAPKVSSESKQHGTSNTQHDHFSERETPSHPKPNECSVLTAHRTSKQAQTSDHRKQRAGNNLKTPMLGRWHIAILVFASRSQTRLKDIPRIGQGGATTLDHTKKTVKCTAGQPSHAKTSMANTPPRLRVD